jgi:hypothetical protein
MTIVDYTLQGTLGVSLLPQRYDIAMYQGDTFEVKCVFKDANGTPLDLTGVEFKCLFVGATDAVADPPSQDQPDVILDDVVNGEITLLILDTSPLNGDYNWDIQLKVTASGKKRTYMGGVVSITKDITP